MPSGTKKRKAAKRKQQQQQQQSRCIHPLPPDSASIPHPQGNGDAVHVYHPAGRDEDNSGHNLSTDEEAGGAQKEQTLENGKVECGNATVEIETAVEIETGQPAPGLVGEVLPASSSKTPISRAGEVDVKFLLTETGLEKLGTEALVVPIVQSDLVNEEVIQATEAIAETAEVAVDARTLVGEAETLPTAIELLQETETSAAAMSIKHHQSETYETAVSTEPDGTGTPKTEASKPLKSGTPESAATTEKDIPASLMQHRTTWWNCCGLFDAIPSSQS